MDARLTGLATSATSTTGDDVNNSDATPRGRGRPPNSEATDPCARCGKPGAHLPKREYCPTCVAAFRREATLWQEKDFAWRWLHGRDDETGWHIEKVRNWARAQGIDWRKPGPKPLTYDQRMAKLTDRAPRKAPVKRAKAKKAESAA